METFTKLFGGSLIFVEYCCDRIIFTYNLGIRWSSDGGLHFWVREQYRLCDCCPQQQATFRRLSFRAPHFSEIQTPV